MEIYSMTDEDINKHCTFAMEETVRAMAREGLIDADKVDEWIATHACVRALRTGFLRRWIEKFFPDLKDNCGTFKIVKVV